MSIVRSITNMLGGSITVRSQVDKGTEVRVQLPLMRIPGADTPISTPSTTTSLDRPQHDSVSILRSQASGKTVALYGFDFDTNLDNSSFIIERVIRQYITSWFELDVVSSWLSSCVPDVIIVDEQVLPTLLSQQIQGTSIIVLCDNVTRYSQPNTQFNTTSVIEMLRKPFGPYKLAKALRVCLERPSGTFNGLSPIQELMSREESVSSHSETLIQDFKEYTLEDEDVHTPLVIHNNGVIAAAETENAHFAIDTADSIQDDVENKGVDFPFPTQSSDFDLPKGAMNINPVKRQSKSLESTEKKTRSGINGELLKPPDNEFPVSKRGQIATVTPMVDPIPPSFANQKRSPKLLLVDDNTINLKLLQTFMKKRKYAEVDSAENGLLAVEAAEMRKDGYDIIFMDIRSVFVWKTKKKIFC